MVPITNIPGAPPSPRLAAPFCPHMPGCSQSLGAPAVLPLWRDWDGVQLATPVAPDITPGCAYHAGAGST